MSKCRWARWTLPLLVLLLASCDVRIGFGEATATPTSLPGPGVETPLPPTAVPTSTLAVPESPAPSPSPPPPTTGTEPEPTRIQFPPGGTSATVAGHVAAYGADLYVLGAMAGQTMEVVLTSPAVDVLLEIWGEDGVPLKRHVDGETSWTGALPATQDYFIKVVSFGSEVDYTLTVTIPPLPPEPTRIQFPPGGTSATVAGHVAAYGADLYVLGAMAGQTMEVVLTSPAVDVLLEIWGEDGVPLKRHVDGETSWTGTLPATQDYFIKVVSFGSEVDYTLMVTIPPP